MSKQDEIDLAMSMVQKERDGELPEGDSSEQSATLKDAVQIEEPVSEEKKPKKEKTPKNKGEQAPKKSRMGLVVLCVIGGLAGTGFYFKDYIKPLINQFTQSDDSQQFAFNCISGDCAESGTKAKRLGNSQVQDVEYVTKEELRKFASNLRIQISNLQDQPEQSDDLIRALDMISAMEMALQEQMAANEALIDRFEQLEMQLANGEVGDVEQLKNQLMQLQNQAGTWVSKISELEEQNKKQDKLDRQLTTNDWEYRQRIIHLEKATGTKYVSPTAIKKETTQTPKVSKNHVGLKKKTPVAKKKAPVAPIKPMVAAENIEWVNDHNWKLKITSASFTQIKNSETNQLLRISQGVDVPGCGLVVDIDVASRKVTTQHCVITRK